MRTIVECVPNFSEGRRPEVVEEIIAAIASTPDVYVLDHEMDADHNRAVVTYVGAVEAVGEAAVRGARAAMRLIDLNHHQGGHPRLGAVDVVPFVPVSGVTMEECVKIAHATGERLWKELGLPVYFYEKAAKRPDRENLAAVRKGQFEGIRDALAADSSRAPDLGEGALHPTAGAAIVGARKFLVAFNMNLSTADVKIADKIARAVRHLSGGLRYVKAMGVMLEGRNIAQVSMNLVDFEGTPIHRVFELVKIEAARYGVNVIGSEIIGLVPQKALDMCSDFYLRVEDFKPEVILENKLAAAMSRRGPESLAAQVSPFLDAVAGKAAVPGGGCVAAHAIASAAALGLMVAGLTLGKKKYAEFEEHVAGVRERLAELSEQSRRGIDEDADSYRAVMDAFALPKDTDEHVAERSAAIERASEHASRAPLANARLGLEVLDALDDLVGRSNPNCASDVKVGRFMALAGVRGALENVRINMDGLKDQSVRRELLAAIEAVEAQCAASEASRADG